MSMDSVEIEQRLQLLHNKRHSLLRRMELPDAHKAALEISLTIVRSELHALYDISRKRRN